MNQTFAMVRAGLDADGPDVLACIESWANEQSSLTDGLHDSLTAIESYEAQLVEWQLQLNQQTQLVQQQQAELEAQQRELDARRAGESTFQCELAAAQKEIEKLRALVDARRAELHAMPEVMQAQEVVPPVVAPADEPSLAAPPATGGIAKQMTTVAQQFEKLRKQQSARRKS